MVKHVITIWFQTVKTRNYKKKTGFKYCLSNSTLRLYISVTIDGVKNPWLFSFFTEREDALKCVRGAIAEIAEVRAVNARAARSLTHPHITLHARCIRRCFNALRRLVFSPFFLNPVRWLTLSEGFLNSRARIDE